MNDGQSISYGDFLSICCVEDSQDFGGYRIGVDGLYANPQRYDPCLKTADRDAALTWHPTGHYDQPALALPCTIKQLREFTEQAGLNGCIDEEELADLLASRQGGADGTRTAARVTAIVETAKKLKYDLLSMPYGGRAAIKRECLDKLAGDPFRFTEPTFKTAWQAARNKGLIKGLNDEIYRGQPPANPHGC
jgi:hypothetical protein